MMSNILVMDFEDVAAVLMRIWSYVNHQFTFGRIAVSVSSLVIGLIVVALTFAIARAATSLMENRLSKRAYIDPGIRYTITRLLRYTILGIGLLFALKQAFAVDLTSIAVLFTALSVGIGFGLQYLAADIASGFILLFERPIRIGDRITIGEDEGDVRSINLRMTTVFTNNQIAIIVPNSKLVSQRVVNWSYGDPRARIAILVSVSDTSNLEVVTKTLVEAARGVDNVLESPAPDVQFLQFGSSSFDLRLLVWSDKPRRHIQIRSDINFRIERLFRERKIKLASPKQEVFVKSVEFVGLPEGEQDSDEKRSEIVARDAVPPRPVR